MSVESVSTENAPGQGLTTKRVSVIVGVLSLAVFMSSLDLFIVNLAFPTSVVSSRLEPEFLSWILNGYTIMFAAVLVPAGVGPIESVVVECSWRARGLHPRFSALGRRAGVAFLIGARVFQAVGAGMMVPRHCRCCSPPCPVPSARKRSVPGLRSARSARHSVP